MNRIILIGNGFDLAHGLPTSYSDFIKYYWTNTIKELRCKKPIFENEDFYFGIQNCSSTIERVLSGDCIDSLSQIRKDITSYSKSTDMQTRRVGTYPPRIDFTLKNYFLEKISDHCDQYNWVDIENMYYTILKNICLHGFDTEYKIDKFHNDFNRIKKSLEEYLISVENKDIDQLIVDEITKKIFSVISIQDLSNSYINDFFKEVSSKIENFDSQKFNSLNLRYSGFKHLDVQYSDVMNYLKSETIRLDDYSDLNRDIKQKKIADYFIMPDSVLFLNFNYTKTHYNYLFNNIGIESNHIHGKLNNKDYPIIFGYGDELEESYKVIENLNNNKFLENAKSIKYLETDNYRRLLSFIDSAPFQIYVMGHSCGNSDRTLLNKMFEHENCVSIKPFYHIKKDGTDNYSDIIRNISRNFTDKSLMRERVVNKTYCEPLLGYKKK